MFEILEPMDAKLATLNLRNEKHGDEDVVAFSATLKITTANTFLDALAPGLRDALYKAVEGQQQLPGVEPATPLLRAKGIERVELAACFEGWTWSVEHGIDEPITIGGAKVDKWRVHPCEGGTVEITCRIGSNDVDEVELGKLGGQLGQVISFTLAAPKVPAPAIDGTTEAFERDHPGADGQADLLDDGAERQADDATATFLGIHGSDEGGPPDSDQAGGGSDGEGSDPEVEPEPHSDLPKTVKYRNPSTGDKWSGRGNQPAWVRAALAAGRTLEEFAV